MHLYLLSLRIHISLLRLLEFALIIRFCWQGNFYCFAEAHFRNQAEYFHFLSGCIPSTVYKVCSRMFIGLKNKANSRLDFISIFVITRFDLSSYCYLL